MNDLFIPGRIAKDNIFGKGFGKPEMKRAAVITAVGVAIGLVVGIIFFNRTIQTILIAMVAVGGLFAMIGYFIAVKNSINLSVYHYLILINAFMKKQKLFLYKKMKEWDNEF